MKANVGRLSSIVTHGKMDEATGLEFSLGKTLTAKINHNAKKTRVFFPPYPLSSPAAIPSSFSDADYRGVFSWNVKQLFLYVTVDYETALNGFNEIIVWDNIVTKEEALIKQRRVKPEYRLVDQGKGLKGNSYNLTVHWNVMPWVGRLVTHKETFGSFKFPGGKELPGAAGTA